jgi:hypothetical protein
VPLIDPRQAGHVAGSSGRRRAIEKVTDAQLDLGKMNMKWVAGTRDPLFKRLTSYQRRILYFFYVREMNWRDIARACQTAD